MLNASSSLVPVEERPIALVARTDLYFERLSFRDESYWVVKDPVSLQYHRLRSEQYELLKLLDGEATLEQIQRKLQKRHPEEHWRALDIQHLLNDLHEKRLLISDRFGQSAGLQKQRRERRQQQLINVLTNFLFLRFPGVYPDRFLRNLYPCVSWMFHPLAVALTVLTVSGATGFLAIHFDEFRRQLPAFHQFFGWPNLLYLWMTLAVIKVFHELGHGLTCRHFGGDCHSIGLMLLVFSPTLYCDVSDSWMLPSKWQRILIAAAGMYVEVFISAIAIFVWWNTEQGMIHHLALNVFFVTSVTTVIFNANPLMRLDGYYILSDWLEMPNLKQRADRYAMNALGWIGFGIEPQEDPFAPADGRAWLGVYAVASTIYRVFLMIAIGWLLYTVLKPFRLEVVAVIIILSAVMALFGRSFWQFIRMIKAPREQPLKKRRIALTLGGLAVLLTAVVLIPIPVYLQASVLVQPHEVRHVLTQSDGLLAALEVAPGEHVEQGQLLMRLENHELEDRLRAIDHEIVIQTSRLETAAALRDPAQKQLAQRRLVTLHEQRQEAKQQLQALEISAPIAGWVVAAESRPRAKLDPADRLELQQWAGQLLDRSNEGCLIEERTHVLSISPDRRIDVVLFIEQDDRDELSLGQEVRMKFDHLPGNLYRASIDQIASDPVEFVPASLTNKTGGPLSTVTDEKGRERLDKVAWQARVTIDEDSQLFVSGLRGRARCLVTHRSLGEWLWKKLRETIHFRL